MTPFWLRDFFFLPGYFYVNVTSAVSLKLWMNLHFHCFLLVLDGVQGTRITSLCGRGVWE